MPTESDQGWKGPAVMGAGSGKVSIAVAAAIEALESGVDIRIVDRTGDVSHGLLKRYLLKHGGVVVSLSSGKIIVESIKRREKD
ncbi:MAG: hypothetical protein AMDU3_IPLC00003G0021 [Thermoplasmatales archaeon I-plasma]|jgi:hypothetical protein|nr:MAG: hypothetical protein AMDU3_IPLC00003G0021 [Thermoplasmatales archaeon I-plasma]